MRHHSGHVIFALKQWSFQQKINVKIMFTDKISTGYLNIFYSSIRFCFMNEWIISTSIQFLHYTVDIFTLRKPINYSLISAVPPRHQNMTRRRDLCSSLNTQQPFKQKKSPFTAGRKFLDKKILIFISLRNLSWIFGKRELFGRLMLNINER